jgi:hypothetical protein
MASTPDAANKDAEFRRKWREINSDQTLTEKEKAARLQDLQRARTTAPNGAGPSQPTPGAHREHTACAWPSARRTLRFASLPGGMPPHPGRGAARAVTATQAILDETLKCTICQNTCDKPVTVRQHARPFVVAAAPELTALCTAGALPAQLLPRLLQRLGEATQQHVPDVPCAAAQVDVQQPAYQRCARERHPAGALACLRVLAVPVLTSLACGACIQAMRGEKSSGAAVAARIANNERPDEAFTTERAVRAGKANAASGRIFVTTPLDHFGPITADWDPVRKLGVRVGDSWGDRLECRQWGAHFPHVAGIAGQSGQGAQSVALSGG